MTILSPLKPLLCRHDYFWSERNHAERCRSCGKLRAGERVEEAPARPAGDLPPLSEPAPFSLGPVDFLDIPEMPEPTAPAPVRATPKVSAKVLKAQARTRRDNLMALLERLSEGRQPSREDAIDAVLAVIEDAHSADPVLFGEGAAAHFAKLHEARDGLIF